MKQINIVAFMLVCSFFCASSFAGVSLKDNSIHLSNYNWTGFYGGLNAGVVGHTLYITDTQATSFLATIRQTTNPTFTGGLQIGYRRQLELSKASGVYGIEVSANFGHANYSQQYGSDFAIYQLNSNNQLNTLILMEFLGGIAANRTLLFLAAGLSWANMAGSTTNLDSVAFFNRVNVHKNQLGIAFGGGIEYAINEKVSARLKIDVAVPNSYSVLDNVGDEFQIANTILQAVIGINYKFK